MNTTMHGKLISRICLLPEVFPGSGVAYSPFIDAENGITLKLSATYHGDHDEFWVVSEVDGIEQARYSVRALAAIVWKQ